MKSVFAAHTVPLAVAFSLICLLAAPPVVAQNQGQGLTLDVQDRAAAMPVSGATTFTFSVRLGCVDLARAAVAAGAGGTKATVTVTATGPAWLNFTSASVEFEANQCTEQTAQNGFVTKEGTFTVTPSNRAPGLTDATITAVARLPMREGEQPLTDDDTTTTRVAYQGGFSYAIEPKSPLTVRNGTVKFTLVVTLTANAKTAVMFTPVAGTPKHGTLTGVPSMRDIDTGFPAAAQRVERINVEYKSTTHEWKTDYANFTTLSHASVGSNPQMIAGTPANWVFTNADAHEHEEKPKDSPGAGAFLGLTLAILVAVLRRRRDL